MIIHFKLSSPSVNIDGNSRIMRKHIPGNEVMVKLIKLIKENIVVEASRIWDTEGNKKFDKIVHNYM